VDLIDVDVRRTALLLMDFQLSVLVGYGPEGLDFVSGVRQLRDAASEAGCLIVYVVSRFRRGHPEVSLPNKCSAR
jgi:hypothetical protein